MLAFLGRRLIIDNMAEKHPLYKAVNKVYKKAYDPTEKEAIEVIGTGSSEEIEGQQENGGSIKLRRRHLEGEDKKKLFLVEIGHNAVVNGEVVVDYITREYAAFREGAVELIEDGYAKRSVGWGEAEDLAYGISTGTYNLFDPGMGEAPPD
jgi:hypothetical protein